MPVTLSSYHARLAGIRSRTVARLGGVWSSLPEYRTPDADRFAQIAAIRVRAAQIASATTTAAYLGGRVDRNRATGARKVDPLEEYRRPFVKVWTGLSEGDPFPEAVNAGLVLLEALVETDLQLAVIAQSQVSLEQTGVQHYRRVLTGSENCDLCRLASTNTYSRADLMPIHSHCDCTVEPVREEGTFDVDLAGLALTAARSQQLLDGASPTSLVATRDHGELGPVLVWSSDHFTGPSDVEQTFESPAA